MEILLVLAILTIFSFLAFRFGADSRNLDHTLDSLTPVTAQI